jgi:hypothetical protein
MMVIMAVAQVMVLVTNRADRNDDAWQPNEARRPPTLTQIRSQATTHPQQINVRLNESHACMSKLICSWIVL